MTTYKELADALEELAEGYLKAEISKAIAILRSLDVQKPVAWGLFAKVEDGYWNLQHPVRFTEEDAKADRTMYEKSTLIDIRPLYAAPVAAQPQQAKPEPLSDEEIAFCIFESKLKNPALTRDGTTSIRIARAAIAAFCQKNGIKEQV